MSDNSSDDDSELEAELAALKSMRSERSARSDEDEDDNDNDKKTKTNNTYNKASLEQKIKDMGNLDFLESMEISEISLLVQDENDDIEREMAFYNHALAATHIGYDKLRRANIPVTRPNDYFCENIKTDAHMGKIKDRLILEEKKIQSFEARKNRDMNKKFNKKLQANKSNSRGHGNDDDGDDSRPNSRRDGEKSLKRINMDKKYGFGGKERHRMKKIATSKSLNDMSDYNPKAGKSTGRRRGSGSGSGASGFGGAGGKSRGKKTANRPGKASRDAKRGARR